MNLVVIGEAAMLERLAMTGRYAGWTHPRPS
jgi:hypothetical protein